MVRKRRQAEPLSARRRNQCTGRANQFAKGDVRTAPQPEGKAPNSTNLQTEKRGGKLEMCLYAQEHSRR